VSGGGAKLHIHRTACTKWLAVISYSYTNAVFYIKTTDFKIVFGQILLISIWIGIWYLNNTWTIRLMGLNSYSPVKTSKWQWYYAITQSERWHSLLEQSLGIIKQNRITVRLKPWCLMAMKLDLGPAVPQIRGSRGEGRAAFSLVCIVAQCTAIIRSVLRWRKGVAHQKIKLLSSFTYSFQDRMTFFFEWTTKEDIL